MNFKQLQNEALAIELLVKYQPIIDDIITLSEGVGVMSEDDRLHWISSHALKRGSDYFFVEEYIKGEVDMGDNVLGLQSDSMGRSLQEKYSSNDIIYACTYHEFLQGNKPNSGAIIFNNPPLRLERKKLPQNEYEQRSVPYQAAYIKGLEYVNYDVRNCRVQKIESTQEDDVNDSGLKPIKGKEDIEKLIDGTPDFIITIDKEQFGSFETNFCTSIDSTTTIENITSALPEYSGGGINIYNSEIDTEDVCNPIMFEIEENVLIAVPDIFSSYIKDSKKKKQDYRFFKTDGGYVIDTSESTNFNKKVQVQGESISVDIRVITHLNVMIFEDFNNYPAVFVKYNPLNPMQQPATAEEVQASQVEALKLPNFILARQMRIPYLGKKLSISLVSLEKWSKSNLSYGAAVEIMTEHLSHYTTIENYSSLTSRAVVRTNNGQVYEQTKVAVEKRLTDSKGKVDSIKFNEIMSKYAFTIEETFFNLNPNFSNPEKLLGYFLGMGISPNNLYVGEISPYRLLCARLLGVDYALNYFDLCRDSAIAGHLFVSSFEEGKPIFCNADVVLGSNIFVTKAKIETDIFQKELSDFFGEEIAPLVLENHQNLLKEYSPKFMKLHHGTKQEYQSAVRNNGVGSPYDNISEKGEKTNIANRMQELTRITLALGLFEGDYVGNGMLDIPSGSQSNTNLIDMMHKVYDEGLERKYSSEVLNNLKAKFKRELTYYSAEGGQSAFSKYSRRMDGISLYGRASDKLRYNNLDKTTAIERFYFDPKSARAGAHNLLTLGLTITNKEIEDDGSARQTEVITIDWENYKKKGQKEPPKLDAKFIQQALPDNSEKLKNLGYDVDDSRVIKELSRIISARASGLYHEIASKSRIEGDELYTLSYSLTSDEGFDEGIEFLFNLKYNNFPVKPINRIPIFLENNRTFGNTKNYIATAYNPLDGSPAGFSLRQAQRDGIRFLGASGNSGLLAHEVGFGKTTSSIAKVSDLFLRGDAKRVLISVPNPVYDSGNWEEEIRGTKDSDGRGVSNGLLPPNVTLVKMGSMNKADLLGKKINESDPDYDEKSEGTGYDGAVAYSESDMQLMENLKGTTEGLIKIVGGAFNKYGKNKETSMLTPREQKYQLDDPKLEDMWIQQNPFFKKSEKYKKENIVRINDTPRQTLSGLTTTIKSGDFDFWDIGDSDYMEFGRLSDILDTSVESKNSFNKKIYEELISKSPNIRWDEENGGDLEKIMMKLEYIHKKYENKYKELTNKRKEIEKQSRGRANIYGGAHAVTMQSVKATAKKNPSYDIDTDKYGNLFSGDQMVANAGYWIAVKTYEILQGKAKDNSVAWFPYYGTRSFWERVVLPWAKKNHKNSPYKSVEELEREIYTEFPFTLNPVNGGDAVDPALESLAKAQIKTALELQMTEEMAYFFVTLSKQAPLFLGKFKEWAIRPNSVVLCSHLAIAKLSVAQQFGEESVDFMAGIYGKSSPTQYLNTRYKYPRVKNRVIGTRPSKSEVFNQGVRTRGETEKLFLSQYRGMDINLLSCDAFVVDEVHNFNRAFNKVKKGSRVYGRIENSKGRLKENVTEGGKVQANVKGSLRYPENVYAYDTKANYNVRGEVQNFISICLYFQERGRKISKGQKRNIENTIFLSATPFTDDNFQMLSLFGALSTSKLMQGNVFNTFDFFQVYAKELWQKDIDYQNRYTLFPKIVGYKNNYALSQLIKTFTNFKISDAEIEAQRPQKVIIGTEAPRIEGAEEDEGLQKVLSQVPFNEAQKKMNLDLNKYITLQTDSELEYTDADLIKAEQIFDKLQKKGKKENPADPFVKELRGIVKVTKRKGKPDNIDYELQQLDEIEELLNEIEELDPDNVFAKAVRRTVDDTDIEGAEGGDSEESSSESVEDDDEEGAINANAVKNEDDNISLAQKIAQRALEASRTQQLTLISPYYLTINNDKSLMNPYLPPLDGTFSENAKNVVENSPKLLYACKAIQKVLEFAYNEKEQRYAGQGEAEPILGQVVYANNYKFRYHGKDFFLFDLMTQYIIDENKDLLETILENSGREMRDVFASIDGRTKSEKTQIVEDFQKGYCLVLFGTSIIKEGINLQKNCPIMYILQVGFVPVTYMQLHGRVWRQKNPYKYAFLINVLTQNSIDAFVYSKLEQKISSVKQMLGSEVYDSEATQFDVDVSEIKINLITDPDKLAEMQWEDLEQELSRDVDRLTEELSAMKSLAADYPRARQVYEDNIRYLNTFSENIYKYESYIAGKFWSEKTTSERYSIATQKLVDAQYPLQFPSEKVRDSFEANPENFKKKDGKSTYESRKDMTSSLRKTVKIKEMKLKEGITKVQEMNRAGVAEREFKLSLKSPFNLDPTESLTAFLEQVQLVVELAKNARQRTEKFERDKSRSEMITEYFEPAAEVAKKIKEGAEPKEVLEALGVFASSRGQYQLRGIPILIIACLQDANPDFVYGNRVDDSKVEFIGARFRTGDEAITIGAFNDLISNEQVIDPESGTSRNATIDDVEEVVLRKQKEKQEFEETLNNEEESKEKLRQEFIEKLKQRDGIAIPSVEERVNDLEAIFPYLNKER